MMDLEERLRSLSDAALPPADEAAIAHLEIPRTTRVSRSGSRRAIRVAGAIAAGLVVILVLNVAAAYFAPKYQQALAGSGVGTISQKFLAAVGLNDGNVTVMNDSATSSGHTIKLVAGYADGLRTVLFVSIDGRGVTGNRKQYGLQPGDWGINFNDMTLTDQFGHSYNGYGIAGPTDLQFETLPWPASQLGARLTLHVTGIEALWKIAEQGPNRVIDDELLTTHGDWTLHATLISAPAHSIVLPASVHTPQIDYAFTSITASETEMVLRWTVAGPVVNQMAQDQVSAPKNADPFGDPLFDQYLRPHLYSEADVELQMQDFGYTWPKTGPALGEMTVFIKGPGRYRMQVGRVVDAWWVVVP